MAESCKALVKAIDNSQIVMLPGRFSGGDEPDGSAKFIASFFRNPEVTEAVRRLLQQRDGLMRSIPLNRHISWHSKYDPALQR